MSGITEQGQMRPGYRSPPHSREAEESVIGAVLLSEEAVNEVMDRLHPPDFYVPAHQAIFEAMRELFDTNQAIDAVTVSEALRRRGELEKVGGVSYLARLVDIVPSTSNILYYAGIVEEHAKRRELIRAGASVTDVAFDIDEEIARVLDRAEQAVLSVAERRSAQTLLEVGPLFSDVLEHIELLEQRGSEMTGLPTGFVDLDKKLAGLQASNLVVIAARPAMGKCLEKSSRVLDPTTGALTAIRDLESKHGSVVAVADGFELHPSATTAWLDQGSQPVFKVTTRLGRSVTATANHPLLTVGGWVELEQLSPGAEIAVAGSLEVVGGVEVLSDAQVALLGYLIGDGSLTSPTPLLTNTCAEIIWDVKRWVQELGLVLSQDPGKPQYRMRKEPGAAAGANPLTTLLRGIGLHGKTAHHKFVPDVIFRSPLRQIALFLNRLYACDGSAWVDKDNYRVEYCTVSEQLADDVQHLLLRFGIVAKKRRREVKYKDGTRTAYDISFQDPPNVEKFIWHIGIYSKMERLADVLQVALNRKENAAAHELLPMEVWDMVLADKGDKSWADVSEATGRPRNHNWHVHRRRLSKRLLRELAKAVSSERLRTLADSDIIWDPIVSIEPAGIRPTYDLTIDGFHNFVANDIIVHNSSMALGVAINAASTGEPVAIFSLEMSKEEIVQRILSSVGRVDSMKLRSGQLGPLWQRVVDAAGKMYQAPIYIDDSPVVTVTDIRAKCRRLKRKRGLSLVVIDYLQLMEASSRENRQQEISEITRNLKNLARELEVPVIAVSQLNRSLETREDKRPRLSDLRESGCLTADTRLVRADTNAEVTLGELVESGATEIPVWSLDDHYRLVASTLTRAFSSGVKPVFELELASGRTVRASGNHPFLTVDGWVRLDDIQVGDRLAVTRRIGPRESSESMTDDQVIVLAHMIGDGCHLARHALQYTTVDVENADIVAGAAARAFGVVPRLKRERTWFQLYLAAPQPVARGRRNPLAEWFDDLGLFDKRSYEKFIPAPVFTLPEDQLTLFVRHLWATDGCVWTDGSLATIYYATSSKRLAADVQSLLTRLDVQTRVRRVRQRKGRDQFHVIVQGHESRLNFLEEVGVAGPRGRIAEGMIPIVSSRKPNPNVDSIPATVWEYITSKAMPAARMSGRELARRLGMSYCGSALYKSGISRARMKRLAGILDDEHLNDLADSDVLWDRVVSITPCGEEEVFDATVELTHNFLANGIVAHNSIEQDADVVMFIYRHEYYHPEEQERKGIAEVIVAKHRAGSTGPVEMTFQPEFTRFANLGRDVT